MKILNVLVCVVMFVSSGFAYTLDDVFKLPEWETDYGWFDSTKCEERVRPYSIIIGRKETILWLEIQTTSRSCKRLEYWASRNACLEAGNARLPYIGSYSKGNLHWTTDKYGYPENWGWDNPQKGKSYFYNLVFRGALPLDDGFDEIRLRDPGCNGVQGYGFGGFRLKPNYFGMTNCKMSEMELRRRFSKRCLPLEGIYETTSEKCWRVACVKQDDGTYHLVFLENGYHKYWSEGDVKAVLRPTATGGLFKARWWNQAFQVLDGVVVSSDGTTLRITSREFPLDNNTSDMTFVKMFPNSSKTDMIAGSPVVDNPFKASSLGEMILLTKVSRTDNETVLEFAGKALHKYGLHSGTVLWYGGTKLPMRKVVGLPTSDGNAIPRDWQMRTFKVYFPPVPRGVKKVDFVEPSSVGSQFVWRGIHLD